MAFSAVEKPEVVKEYYIAKGFVGLVDNAAVGIEGEVFH